MISIKKVIPIMREANDLILLHNSNSKICPAIKRAAMPSRKKREARKNERVMSPKPPICMRARMMHLPKNVNLEKETALRPVTQVVEHAGDDSLYDGVFLKAVIPGRTIPHACMVPRKALYEQMYVYVVEDGRLVYRQVHIARREPEYVIVDEGLKNGDLLVVEMLQGVSPGMLASPKPHNAAGKSS